MKSKTVLCAIKIRKGIGVVAIFVLILTESF